PKEPAVPIQLGMVPPQTSAPSMACQSPVPCCSHPPRLLPSNSSCQPSFDSCADSALGRCALAMNGASASSEITPYLSIGIPQYGIGRFVIFLPFSAAAGPPEMIIAPSLSCCSTSASQAAVKEKIFAVFVAF